MKKGTFSYSMAVSILFVSTIIYNLLLLYFKELTQFLTPPLSQWSFYTFFILCLTVEILLIIKKEKQIQHFFNNSNKISTDELKSLQKSIVKFPTIIL